MAASQAVPRTREPWDLDLPAGDILRHVEWPDTFPLSRERHLKRIDESPDTNFYAQPRLVHHIDDYARQTLGAYYATVLPKGGHVLDLMSSWTSHLADGTGRDKSDGHFARVAGLGMHEAELVANPALHDYHVHDLNRSPSMPMYADGSFDAVFCSVSVDYLANPLPVIDEIHRVLKPGGLAVR
jgi:SAM-dependent methyltransferase